MGLAGRLRNNTWKYASLATELAISQSEVFQAIERSRLAGLIDDSKRNVNKKRLLEFLIHGLRYVFPPEKKGVIQGTPLFAEEMLIAKGQEQRGEAYVWVGAGSTTGEGLEPLHKSIPNIAIKDKALHEVLAYVEILRFHDSAHRTWVSEKLRALLDPAVPVVNQSEDPVGTVAEAPAPGEESDSPTKQAILVAAAKICAKLGFETASLKDIAQEAGVTPAMVGYHFGNKRALILELIRSQLQDVGKSIGGILMLGRNVQEAHMREMFGSFLNLMHTNSDFYRINLWTLSDVAVDMVDVIRGPFTFMIEEVGRSLQHIAGGQGEVDKICRGLIFTALTQQFAILRWTYLARLQTNASAQEILERCRTILTDDFLTPLLRKENLGT